MVSYIQYSRFTLVYVTGKFVSLAFVQEQQRAIKLYTVRKHSFSPFSISTVESSAGSHHHQRDKQTEREFEVEAKAEAKGQSERDLFLHVFDINDDDCCRYSCDCLTERRIRKDSKRPQALKFFSVECVFISVRRGAFSFLQYLSFWPTRSKFETMDDRATEQKGLLGKKLLDCFLAASKDNIRLANEKECQNFVNYLVYEGLLQ